MVREVLTTYLVLEAKSLEDAERLAIAVDGGKRNKRVSKVKRTNGDTFAAFSEPVLLKREASDE